MSEYSNIIYSRFKIYPDSIEREIFNLIDDCHPETEIEKVIDIFYSSTNLSEVDRDWLLTNIGCEDILIGREDDIITTETNHFTPSKFLMEIYKLCVKLDPDASIYCKYYDEYFNLVGSLIIKDGIFCEKDECLSLQIPEYDDPNYDLFLERMWKIVIDSQDDYIDYCEKSIDEYLNKKENLKYNDCNLEVIAEKMWIFNKEEDNYGSR
jgi:hypothetical protein